MWYACLCAFWCICFQIGFAYEVFLFNFGASVFRLQLLIHFFIRGWNIHMALYPWRRNWSYKFPLLWYTQYSGQDFFDSQTWSYIYLFAIFVNVFFFAVLISSTRLAHLIHVVFMNLKHIGQISIKGAQRGATAVQVCSLNPAGWSVMRLHYL